MAPYTLQQISQRGETFFAVIDAKNKPCFRINATTWAQAVEKFKAFKADQKITSANFSAG